MKRIFTFAACLAMLLLFTCTASAQQESFYEQQLRESGAAQLKDKLSDETADYLDRLGYGDMDFTSMLAFEPGELLDMLLLIAKGKLPGLIGITARLLAVIMIIAVAQSFFPSDDGMQGVLSLISGAFIIITVFAPASAVISAGAAAIGVCAGFEKALIPVLAAVLTASGNPVSALSYQGMVFAASQAVTQLVTGTALPLLGAATALNVIGAVSPALKLSAIGELIRKVMLTTLSIASALFSGMLALKSVLASSADTLAAKGVKLAVSSFVPVIGGALSDAYSTIIGSMALIKNTVGAFAVAAVFLTLAPVIIELAMWTASLKICGVFAELFGMESPGKILHAAENAMSLSAVLTAYCGVIFIISSALVILLKGG